MGAFKGFDAGVNLGGWISQYRTFDPIHFDSFIRREDIARIASWGMDHVRLPFDYPVVESDDQPFVYLEEGLGHLDDCLKWCQEFGLNLIFDLHKAAGYSFGEHASATLFNDPIARERFLRLWETLALRYRSQMSDKLVFELLNEMVQPTSGPWNKLAHEAFARIRKADPQRWVMVGGNNWNSAWTLKDIELIPDPRVVYTFHFYEPMPFTHQRASWNADTRAMNAVVEYPGMVPNLAAFLDARPEFRGSLEKFLTTPMDLEYLKANLQPALDFQAKSGLPLYCGEYGVIDHAPLESRLRWHRDFTGLLRQHGIGKAVWSYKEMGFRLVNRQGEAASEELVRIVAR